MEHCARFLIQYYPSDALQGDAARASAGSRAHRSDCSVDLIVSTVKLDADEYDAGLADLPFCFRVISPSCRLTLQAESDADRAAWVAALQGATASLPPRDLTALKGVI